jgi:pyruvate dehydrogenase (quinone)
VVIEFVTDPDVPPLPPHITFAQAKAFMSSLAKRDPDAPGMIRQALREIWAGLGA